MQNINIFTSKNNLPWGSLFAEDEIDKKAAFNIIGFEKKNQINEFQYPEEKCNLYFMVNGFDKKMTCTFFKETRHPKF